MDYIVLAIFGLTAVGFLIAAGIVSITAMLSTPSKKNRK